MIELLKRSRARAIELNVRRMSAALALYLLMSFAPLLVVVIGLAGFAVGQGRAEGLILSEIGRLLGPERAQSIAQAVDTATHPTTSSGAALVGLLALLWSSSRLFFEIERDLEEVWNREHQRRHPGWRGVWRQVRRRLISLGTLLLLGLLLVAAVGLRALLGLGSELLAPHLPKALADSFLGRDLWLLLVVSVTIGLVYRLLPDPRPGWRAALLAGMVAGSALTLGLVLIGALLGLAARYAILATALSPLVGLSGLYLASAVFFGGAILCRELDRS